MFLTFFKLGISFQITLGILLNDTTKDFATGMVNADLVLATKNVLFKRRHDEVCEKRPSEESPLDGETWKHQGHTPLMK